MILLTSTPSLAGRHGGVEGGRCRSRPARSAHQPPALCTAFESGRI